MSILDVFRLEGRRALITGGSRGLGRAMAQALAEAGAELVLVGRDEQTLQHAQTELATLGRRVAAVVADLTTPPAVERMCAQVLAEHGPIDILINNVGGRRENIPVTDQTLADWQRLIDLNLTSAFLCTRTVGGAMLPRRWGRVINIGSICGQVATRNIHGRHYEMAKAALAGFTRAGAADRAPHRVTGNAIPPGGFITRPHPPRFPPRPAPPPA